jgi:hypothetical protein
MNTFLAYITIVDSGAQPSHPIAPGGSPGFPSHPIAPGGGPSQGPGFPTHPIAPGGQPPGIWPSPGRPDQGLPQPPPGIWPSPGHPAHPIFIPPDQPPVDPPEDDAVIEWKTGWTAEKGWVTVGIVTPDSPVPTPSSQTTQPKPPKSPKV